MSRLAQGLESLAERMPSEHLRDALSPVGADMPSNEALRHLLGGDGSPAGFDPGRLLERGKVPRLRTMLVALAARSVGAGSVDTDIQHAVEMLHLALVVHDLALGKTPGRRRKVALGVVRLSADWLTGNHLSLRALELVRAGPVPELLGEAVDTLRAFSSGQALTRELQGGPLPSLEDWRDRTDAHEGALYAFSSRAGARLGTTDVRLLGALGRYGRHIGRQCAVGQDTVPLLDERGPAHLLERAASGVPVFPLIAAAEDDPSLAAAWWELVQDPAPALADALAQRLRGTSALPHAREALAQESWNALRALRVLPESPYRYGMERLTQGMARVLSV
ncbi:MAG: polyprenyl synthetase family protein [Deltaproteobacteria bacterium]|nr:polyprenyl synthetase family protein [Deltaproteobacteria bacterium]